MKILHIGEYVKGGVYTYINQLATLQNREHDVYIMVAKENSETGFDIDHKNLIFYEYKRHPRYFLTAMRQYKKIINSVQPDIIHIHSTFAGLLARIIFLVMPKKAKIVYCAHGWAFTMETSMLKKRIYAMVEKLLSYRTDSIVNISNKEQQAAEHYGIPINKMVTVYNGVSPSSDAEPIEMNSNKINVLFVGRWDRQKGIDILFDAIKQIDSDRFQFHIVGEKVLNHEKINAPDNVKCYGWIGKDEIDKYYKACDCVIIPSRWEGFGLVAIEAMRNKKPVIASNRGSLPEIVIHNENGLIFDFEQLLSLVEIFRNLNKNHFEEMGNKGYQMYMDKFRMEFCHEKIMEIYETA